MAEPIPEFQNHVHDFALLQPVVKLNDIVVLADQTQLIQDQDGDPDVLFLQSLELPEYLAEGSADMPMHTFLVDDKDTTKALSTSGDIIGTLQPRHYASDPEHPIDLTATTLPFDYQADGFACHDIIHNDFDHQMFFPKNSDRVYDWQNEWLEANGFTGTPPPPPPEVTAVDRSTTGPHGQLKAYVRDHQIWYTKLHNSKTIDDISELMIMCAVGVSPHVPHRLVGFIAGQSPD